MITIKSEIKKHSITESNFQALCDYLCYNTSIEEYKKARNKLNKYFNIKD